MSVIKTEPEKEILVIEPKSDNLNEFATNINPEGYDLYQALFNQRQPIPTQEELMRSRELNRTQSVGQPKGLWQIAVKAERDSLRRGMQNYGNEIQNKVSESLKQFVSPTRLVQLVDYLPNYNFPYYNKLIKMALKGIANNSKTTTRADYSHIQGMRVLNLEAEKTFLALLSASQDVLATGFSVTPPTSRSKIPLKYENGEARLELRNPGTLVMSDNNGDQMVSVMNKIVEVYDNKIRQIQDNIELANDQSALLDLTGVKSELGKSLVWLMDKLSDSHVAMRDLMTFSEKLHNQLSLKRSRYFLSIAQPWKHRTARVPAFISPPSATFSLRGILPLTTNATGNVAFTFNPFFLSQSTSQNSTVGINNNVALTGSGSSNFFVATAVGQALPADFYVRYRLVSAGLRLYCYPSSNNDNGIASVSVTFEDIGVGSTTVVTNLGPSAQFGDFTQIENGYFKQTTTIASREVQEHVYIPIDESFFDYRPVDFTGSASKNGFAWTGYISGAAPSSTIARIEFACNFEALLDNAYMDYLPSDNYTEDIDPKQIPIIVNRLKNEEYLSPKKINDALREENVGLDINDIIELPTPPKKKKQEQERLKVETKDLGDILKDMIPAISKPKVGNWVSDIMDVVSPITSSIISSVANKYVPFLPMFNKF